MVRLLALFTVTLLACKGGSPPPTTPGGGDGNGGDGPATPVEPVLDTAALGQPCGEADACPTGTTCVSYLGIAGASGPEFKSCEITCAGKGACPDGTSCITIADGPGEVCR
jgi:hypothetical protein